MLSIRACRLEPGFVAQVLSHLEAQGPFTAVGQGDVRAYADTDIVRQEITISWFARTPRGAAFLGELASVGFFGAEAQQLLT